LIADRETTPPLPPEFYARSAEDVARALVGTVLRSDIDGETVTGRIVETEAYVGPHDPASHAAERFGRTARNASMFGRPGIAYVYRSYGVHWCLNVVTDRPDYPAAVLIRAVEPLDGLDAMTRRRGTKLRDLARGPGRLTQAFGITGALDGHPLDQSPLTLHAAPDDEHVDIAVGPRVGISRAVDWPLRFRVRDSPWVSR
jgi:DNA-3-methyladenine glycosylase